MRLNQLFYLFSLVAFLACDLRSQPSILASKDSAARSSREAAAENSDVAVGRAGPSRSTKIRQVNPPPEAITPPPATPSSGATPLTAPILGLVLTQDHDAVRAIVGTPGASQFTGDLPIAGSVSKVYLPPHQKYLLIEQLATDPIAVVPFRGVTVGTPAAIPGALPRADLVAFSPSGGVAAFYNTTSDEAQVITGLPNTPQISHQIQQVKLPEPVSTLAISDDGSVFVAGSQGNHIYLLSQNSAPQLLWSAGDLAALAFYPAQHSLVACDRSSGSLVILDQVGTALTTRTLAGPLPSLGPGVNLQLDDSGKRVVISNPASNQVHVIDQSGSVQSLSLPASPVSIKQLANPTLFALTEVDGQSGLVLSLNSVPAQYFYVPRRVIVVQHVLKTGVQ